MQYYYTQLRMMQYLHYCYINRPNLDDVALRMAGAVSDHIKITLCINSLISPYCVKVAF
jgi:hypothetical protein